MHGSAQLVVWHRSDKPVRGFDFVEDVNNVVGLVDLASSRVEEQDHAT